MQGLRILDVGRPCVSDRRRSHASLRPCVSVLFLFRPGKVGGHEYHEKPDVFRFFTLEGEAAEINLPPNALAFTLWL